jgi:hypothetical protein
MLQFHDARVYEDRDQTDLEAAMEAYAPWLEQQREDEIVPPEVGHRFVEPMEAAGIEPAQRSPAAT